MKTERLKTWSEFQEAALSLIREADAKREKTGEYVSQPIFRGQGVAKWDLCTTLDRKLGPAKRITMPAYHNQICTILPSLQSFNATFGDLSRSLNVDSFESLVRDEKYIRVLEYMAYLRHYGYPSPLLDWSRSPYIASFFAYRDPRPSDEIAIYAFQEFQGDSKGWWPGKPHIRGVGPHIRVDKRHVIQQSQYTVCLQKENDGKYYYASHQLAFDSPGEGQDYLVKYVLPVSERVAVLKWLDLMNVNSMSLFQNEEGLMETLSFRCEDE